MNEHETLEELKAKTERLQEEVRSQRVHLAGRFLDLAKNFVRMATSYHALGAYNQAKRAYNAALAAYKDSKRLVRNPPQEDEELEAQFVTLREAIAKIPKTRRPVNPERTHS